MDALTILTHSLWAALFATGLAVIYTAPARYLVPTFLCGLIGSAVRDGCVTAGINQHGATVMAAAVVVVVAAAIIRRHTVSPVVLVCAVLPLGGTVAIFNLLLGLMEVSSVTGEALNDASVAVITNFGKALAASLSIVIGISAGLAIARLFSWDRAVGV
jgi:uncharacterized membrane protein YjjB (DUF3815 family)